jgi:hypothetical protein
MSCESKKRKDLEQLDAFFPFILPPKARMVSCVGTHLQLTCFTSCAHALLAADMLYQLLT